MATSTKKRKSSSSLVDERGMCQTIEKIITWMFKEFEQLPLLCKIICNFSLFLFFLVPDEESTIEEQEAMEGEADHKAELVELAKDGTYLLNFFVYVKSWVTWATQHILTLHCWK